jgi:hypothetical protein
MATFKNLKELNKTLQQYVQSALENEVAEAVKDEMVDQIDEVVYAAYTPYNLAGTDHHYHRTYKLKDRDSMKSTMPNNNTLEVENIREGAETVITGVGYTWGKNSGYVRDLDAEIGARDFIQGTRNSLSNNKAHVKALKDALRKKGIRVED